MRTAQRGSLSNAEVSEINGWYSHSSLETCVAAHVDDLMCVGPRGGLDNFLAKLKSIYDLASTLLGPGPGEEQEGKFWQET